MVNGPNSDRRTFLRAALAGVAGLSITGPMAAAGRQVDAQITALPLSGNLTLLSGAGANVVAHSGPSGILLVDGGRAESSGALLNEVGGLSGGGGVHTLFNTHWHPEQTGLNVALGRAGARIIAHENTRLWLTTDITRPWENRTFQPMPAEGLPNDTFYTSGEIEVDGERVEYGYMLQAHTDGDIYVFFPEADVVVAGGVVSADSWPLIDWWTGGWINGLVDGLETLLAVAGPETRIVPANGGILSRPDLEAQHEMYATISQRLRAVMYSGRSPDDAIAERPTAEYDERMGPSDEFVRRAFESMWGHFTPDA